MAARMSEEQLLSAVLETTDRFGWRSAHVGAPMRYLPKARGGGAIPDKRARGFPDLVLVRGTRLVFAELKSDTGRVTSEQQAWLDALDGVAAEFFGAEIDAKVEVYLWRPHSWPDAIVAALR